MWDRVDRKVIDRLSVSWHMWFRIVYRSLKMKRMHE
jgi:hypothetical protein